MKNFNHLEFSMQLVSGNNSAVLFFGNGYGVSVITGPRTYGGISGLYELAVVSGDEYDWNLCYSTEVTDDVEGWLTPSDVSRLMAQVQKLPANNK